MNCLFCRTTSIGVVTYITTYTICMKCLTRYRFGQGTIQAYALCAKHKDKWYAAEFKVTEPVHFILYLEDEQKCSSRDFNEWSGKELLKLDYLPKIDHHNIEDRLPTLLVFS